jgi:predicted  nucleic acid-binding Zn-ribbon protein
LTVLRPIVRAYEYLNARLSQIGEQVKYPREDIVELRNRSTRMEQTLNQLSDRLNLQSSNSWAAQQQELMADLRRQIAVLNAQLIEMQAKHDQDLERVSRESRQAIAQLTLDSQFVEHIREIIRFFKSA